MSDELPKGWASARLEEIVTKKKGKKPAILRDTPAEGFVPYLDIHAIEKNVVREYAEVKSSKIASKDDLFVVWDGARSGWVGGGITGAIGSTIMALTAQTVESVYVRQFIASQFKNLNTNTRGTGIPHVDPEVFWNLEVPLAPLAEQRRIVAKLEKLLGQVDACQQRLEKLPKLLKRFRQSILAAACSGRLTADWRKQNPKVESPDERVAAIAKINAGKSNREIERAKRIKTEEWFFDIKDELPESWLQVNFMDVTWLITCGVAKRPNYVEKGIPFLSAQNAKPFKANLKEVKYISEQDFKTFTVGGKPEKNDILYSRVGAKFGEAAKVPFDFDFAIYVSLTLIKPIHELIDADFLVAYLNSYHGLVQAYGGVLGSGIQNLNVENVRRFRVPLPPLAEQQEIVRRVAGLFALADQLEQRLAQARKQVDKLMPSLLARAFAGKLVPQDPNDEPAEKLLERIKCK